MDLLANLYYIFFKLTRFGVKLFFSVRCLCFIIGFLLYLLDKIFIMFLIDIFFKGAISNVPHILFFN